MSDDAAGIVATLYALCEMCGKYRSDNLNNKYHALRDFACDQRRRRAPYSPPSIERSLPALRRALILSAC